jgi:hypothetical protein
VEGASKQMDGPSGLSFSRGLEVNLRHNLSTRENNEREHVMSWATYGGPEMTNSKTEVSPIMEQRWSGSSMTPLSPMSSDGCAAR